MQTLATLRDLFRHMEWADALVWKSVNALPSDAALRDKLQHLHEVQHSFLLIWRRQPFDRAFFARRELPQLRQWARDYYRDVPIFLAPLASDQLDEVVALPWAERIVERLHVSKIHPTTLGETLLQVAMHSSHHRGQIAQRIRELGGEPPLVDYIAWLWFGKPMAQW